MKTKSTRTQNERIAWSIILSNTNATQRASLFWIAHVERAIVQALDAKDAGLRAAYSRGVKDMNDANDMIRADAVNGQGTTSDG